MTQSSPESPYDAGPASHSGTTSGDVKFVNAMAGAGLLTELSADELELALLQQQSADAATRYLDILEHYYAANGDANVGLRRRMTDRFFMHHAGDPATAKQLLVRLVLLAPELTGVALDRIPGDGSATIVLRAGNETVGVFDDAEDALDAADGTVSVRALVRAINVLLERRRVRERFIPLMRDDGREAYVATPVTGALNLCQSEYLEEVDVERLMEFASW